MLMYKLVKTCLDGLIAFNKKINIWYILSQQKLNRFYLYEKLIIIITQYN